MLKFHIDIYLLLSILLLEDFFTKVNQDYWSIKRKVGKYISRVSPFVTYLLCEVMIHTIIQARIVCQYAHSFLYGLFAYLFSVTTKGVLTNNGTKKGQGKTIFSLVWNKCWFIVHHGQTIVSPPPLMRALFFHICSDWDWFSKIESIFNFAMIKFFFLPDCDFYEWKTVKISLRW